MRAFIDRIAGIPWREVPWGLIVVLLVVAGIILGGFWAAFEIYSRAN